MAQLETMLRKNTLTLHRLWYLLQPSADTLQLLAYLCRDVMGSTRGGALLGRLERALQGTYSYHEQKVPRISTAYENSIASAGHPTLVFSGGGWGWRCGGSM